jgi:hypothetical protein
VPCESYQSGNDFLVCAATYLSGSGDDGAAGVDVAADGTVVYVGTSSDNDFGQTPTALLGGGAGVVVRTSSDGRTVLSVTRIGQRVSDVEVAADTGQIAVSGDFGVALLDAEAKAVVWNEAVGNASHVAAGKNGTVAALVGKAVSVFDAQGGSLGNFSVSGTTVNDIALDSATSSVFAAGFKQDDGPPCSQLQIPFLRAYGYTGTEKWKAYDWNRTEVGAVSECADTRGITVVMGDDGKLYYAGESHGGNTVHRDMPTDLSQAAPNESFDKYNTGYNMNGAAPIGYYARFDAGTGQIEKGQFILTRLSSDKGNAARPTAIAADSKGNVYVAGGTACCIENGAQRTINGSRAMSDAYLGGGFLLIVSPDFKQRLSWTTFRGETGNDESPVGVGVASGIGAIALMQSTDTSTTEAPMLTVSAVQAAPPGGKSDGYAAVWPAP